MAVTDLTIRKALSKKKPYKIAVEKGLYVIVRPNGAKWWRFDCVFDGKRKTKSLGTYPDVSLKDARHARDDAKACLRDGVEPLVKEKTPNQVVEVTFKDVADEFLARMEGEGRSDVTVGKSRWLLMDLAKALHDIPIASMKAADILAVLTPVESSGRIETAHRLRANISRVHRYAVATLRADTDPTFALRGALQKKVVHSHPAVTEERPFGALLNAVDAYGGWGLLRSALQIQALCLSRPVELRKAEWSHFDLEVAEWRIPATLTKMRREHVVPLSRQALDILKEVRKGAGDRRFVFHPKGDSDKPISENAMNFALRKMGYSGDVHVSHGFRSSASTILNKRGFKPDVIEAALAHVPGNAVRRIYNRYQYWDERVEMMQAWADICDELKESAKRKSRNNEDLV